MQYSWPTLREGRFAASGAGSLAPAAAAAAAGGVAAWPVGFLAPAEGRFQALIMRLKSGSTFLCALGTAARLATATGTRSSAFRGPVVVLFRHLVGVD